MSAAASFIHQRVTWPIALVAVIVLVATVVFARSPASRRLDLSG